MLNELITWVLNTYLGKYLEDFNPAQLSIALVSGEVELENVPIRKDALRSFGIPIEALSGTIGRIKLQIPVRQFRTSPWSIAIERVYGVFGPKDVNEWDCEKEKEAEYAYKSRVLDAKEANWRVDNGCRAESYYSLSYTNWLNYGASLTTNILENLELKINDVHLRYEDTVTVHQSQIATGIRINSITAQSCDSNWIPGTKNPDQHKISFKLLELKDFIFYWDKLDSANMCSQLSSKDLLDKMANKCKFNEHKFLTNPINATAKFKRERCKQALRNKNRPRISCDVALDQVNISVNEVQYTEIVDCAFGLQNINRIRSFKILRPTISILNDPKIWWRYAAKCYGFTFRTSEDKWKIAKENIRYISIYRRLIINPSENISKEEKLFKDDFEKKRSLDDLKILRDICYDVVRFRGMNIRNRNIIQEKSILYHWFPNWLGWYGVSDSTNTDAKSPMTNDETYKNIEDDILSALKETIENDTFSKRDAIFGNFTFVLADVSISLKSTRCEIDVTILDMELQHLFGFIEIKPKLTSYRVGISMGSIRLKDKFTESTEFPYLIRPQKQENTNQKSLYNEFLNLFTKKCSVKVDEEPWFQLQYERNPPEHQSDYRLIIKSKSLDVVYNEKSFTWLVSFFFQPISDLKSNVNVQTDHKFRTASRLKFFKNWNSVLLGQKDNRKKWSFEIDISAPRIICVEHFQDKNSSVVLIDFGRFQLFRNECSTGNVFVIDANASEKDSDDELFMTPCSTPPGSQTSKSASPVGFQPTASTSTNDPVFLRFFINSDTGLESELYSEMYDKYVINLTDLQILVCKNRECGYACAKSSSNFHLLDKFNIYLHLERRIIDTSDPEYPSITLFGNLNRIVAHINEQKISECLRILNPITFNLFKPSKYPKADEIDIDNDDKHFEDSNTTIFQFIIGQIILEIQSREKSIAEIQIIGAKAGITNKTTQVNISMSVHGFLLVDAIQSFGPDFELLVASHRHVEMDSISGSLKQSEPCSPTSPGSPDLHGYNRAASPNIINRAVNELQTGMGLDVNVDDALITIDLNIINPLDGVDAIKIANITFNNLDVIANQETIVELLGFGKRIVDNYKSLSGAISNEEYSVEALLKEEHKEIGQLKYEMSFDFHRLNILVLRSTRIDNINVGCKVGTLTMSEAKIHASLSNEICISGALGGIQVIDITPEGFNHQRIFSVGKDPLADPPKHSSNGVLYTLTNEMYGNDFDDEYQYTNALSFQIVQAETSPVVIRIRMASVWYTHCPRFIEEIYMCVKEFKQYFKIFLKSLRNKASHMAKGLVQHISSGSYKQSCNKFGEVSLDVILSSPVLVLPRSCQSNEVMVANLGKITIYNRHENSKSQLCSPCVRNSYVIDVRNINLFSLNTHTRKSLGVNALPKANEMYSCQSDAVPILHDTALLFQCTYESKTTTIDTGWDYGQTLLINGSVTQNLHVSMSKYQYEQLIDSLNYATNVLLARDNYISQHREENLIKDAVIDHITNPSEFQKISIHFTVPILKLDLRNEHNDSLVHLTFQEFSFKDATIAGERKEVQVLLRSVLMEDLKCPATSKYRNMVNSSSDIDDENHCFRSKMSRSCPNLSKYKHSNMPGSYGSIPSNLSQMINSGAILKEDNAKASKKIRNIQTSQKASSDNLVIYTSLVTKSVQNSNLKVTKSSIDFNCLNLIISIDKWFMVFDFFGLISNCAEKGEEPLKQSPRKDAHTMVQELLISIRSLNLNLVRNESELAKANVSNVRLHIRKDSLFKSIHGRLGSISIYDLTPYCHLYQEKFSTTGMEALSFTYKRATKDEPQISKRSLEKDAQLSIYMSSVKYVHTKRFIMELHLFVKALLQLQSPVINRIKNNNPDDKNRNNNFLKIDLQIQANSPIILLPVSYNSNHLLIADLGKFTLRNSFHYCKDLPNINDNQSVETSYNEIIDLMNVDLVNINLLTGERETKYQMNTTIENSSVLYIGNFCIIKLGETIFKEKCHLKIQVMRNTESDISHNNPDIRIEGTISELNGLINLQQYKLIRGFLNYNLGEATDDVYYNYQVNLNESLEKLSSITKINSVQIGLTVWKTLSINFILDNVTIYLAEPIEFQSCQTSDTLACIKFIKSNLEIDSFSDGSQDIDLISTEILLMDARESHSKSARKNCFKYILKPSTDGALKSTVQAEIHSRKRNGLSKYTILLNNMRIMALIDYLEQLKNFLNEEPYMSAAFTQKSVAVSNVTLAQNNGSSRIVNIEENLQYEFVLNITNSEIVFVEDCAKFDTNAIILKSTTVFSYKPGGSVIPISIDINHLEIFSCVLGSESESSLSIIDPFTLNMELRNDSFHILIQSQLFLRVSYNDVMLFSRMMHSIPKQKEKQRVTQFDDFEKISPLTAMGFKYNDCCVALQINNNNINEAAIWLSHQKVKNASSCMKISHISLNANCISICIIDDCLDADVPLLEVCLSNLRLDQKLELSNKAKNDKCYEGEFETVISSNYYNRRLSGWEPIIEAWECYGNWKYSKSNIQKLKNLYVLLNSRQILKFNITSTFIELCGLVRKNWTEDYFVRSNIADNSSPIINARQRLPFVPFALKNLTGEPLLFTILYTQAGGITRTEVTQQDLMCNWISAQHNETVPFDFGPQSKWRHVDSHKLNMHQILVQIHGWTLIGPISIDKVGIYFRYANLDMQYSKKTRIVFEIDLVGSAQKLITVRSALNAVNNTNKLFFLRMKLKNESETAVMTINPQQKITIPLRYVDSSIYLKPYIECDSSNQMYDVVRNDGKGLFRKLTMLQNDETGFCTRSISWLNCTTQDTIQDTHSCFYQNKTHFHVLSEIKKDKYPMRDTGAMPGHTITILPPLKLKNLLCCDVLYKVNGHAEGRIDSSGEVDIYSVDIRESFCLNLTLDNYKLSGQINIPMGHSGIVEPKFKLVDLLNRELFLRVTIQSLIGKGMEILIAAPIWVINKTGLPLIFRQNGTNHHASGQFEEHEYAREVSPLMFSFSDQEGSPLLEFRLGKSYGANNLWCKSFGIHKETTFRELKAEKSKMNYVVGVNIKRGKGLYFYTTFITLTPRFQLYNRSAKKLQFAQKCDVLQSMFSTSCALITALPDSNFPFHWSNCEQEPLLCVRVVDDAYCHWSKGLPVNEAKSLYINLRNEVGEMTFLRLEIILHGGTYILHFTDAHTLPPPIRVDNFSEVSIHFSQKGVEPFWRTSVKSQSSLAYVLDDPLGLQTLRIEAPGGNSIEYPLNKDDAAQSLTYANFIYIAFKETFRFNTSEGISANISIEGQQLVLGVKDKQVIISRKCTGDRSQLWLMNSYGQLEHEGSSPPTEYLKATDKSPRLVLDLEKPPNPTEYTKLVVRPQNNQRITTQTWRFENGRLMCHANMCVQAANGIYGLKPGYGAVLGRIETSSRATKSNTIPIEQSIEIQKLRPGSGHLEVISKMDGPIKSIQIHDVKSNSEEKLLAPDPLWRHASVFNKKLVGNTRHRGLTELLIKLTLVKGLGLSIVTRMPCEEIVYLSFEDIVFDILLLPFTKCLDLKVGDLQIDNQLLETTCPIMLYTLKSQKEDNSKDAIILKAKMLPSPNKNAVIFEQLSVHLKPCALLLEERLVLKIALFLGYGSSLNRMQQQNECHIYRVDDYPFSKNSKRFFFEKLAIGSTQIRLTVLTAPKLNSELIEIKKALGLTLIKFEDALIEFDKFTDRHHFETLDIYIKAVKIHYVNQLKWHAASILGSVDFLGNPLGFAYDLSEGVSGLLLEGSVKSLVKNVTHGISNSTAKLTESLSESLGRVVLDERDNETRQRILEISYPTTGGHLTAGLKGFGFGLLGGVTSIVRHTYVGAQMDGFPGFLSGLGKGIVGTITKPLIGVLDLASETASAVRETSRGSHHCLPERKRLPRCVTGAPGGLLPNYSYRQSKGQQYLYLINRRNFSEKLIFYEPNLCNDREAKLRLLVSSEFIRIFSRCEEDPAIMIECHLSEVLSCHPLTTTTNKASSSKSMPSYYIEISTNLPKVTRPRVRCQNEETAERASRCINYSKAVFDEREHSLANH